MLWAHCLYYPFSWVSDAICKERSKQKCYLAHARKILGVICNPNCLLSEELMAKYSKEERIFSVGFKPFNYWGCKGVMSCRNSAWVVAK